MLACCNFIRADIDAHPHGPHLPVNIILEKIDRHTLVDDISYRVCQVQITCLDIDKPLGQSPGDVGRQHGIGTVALYDGPVDQVVGNLDAGGGAEAIFDGVVSVIEKDRVSHPGTRRRFQPDAHIVKANASVRQWRAVMGNHVVADDAAGVGAGSQTEADPPVVVDDPVAFHHGIP